MFCYTVYCKFVSRQEHADFMNLSQQNVENSDEKTVLFAVEMSLHNCWRHSNLVILYVTKVITPV